MPTDVHTSTVHHNALTAYLAQPATPSAKGVLLLPMITGIGARVREFAAEFAASGLTTLCWDPFPGASSDTHAVAELRDRRDTLDDRTVLGELGQLVDYMTTELATTQVGVVGYCLGGRYAVLFAAADPRVSSLVAYHPTVPVVPEPNHSIDPFQEARRVTAAAMVHYPGQDHLVPWEGLTRLRDGLEANAAQPVLVAVYPDAEHGFSDSAHHGNGKNVAAYALAQPQTLAFLHSTLR